MAINEKKLAQSIESAAKATGLSADEALGVLKDTLGDLGMNTDVKLTPMEEVKFKASKGRLSSAVLIAILAVVLIIFFLLLKGYKPTVETVEWDVTLTNKPVEVDATISNDYLVNDVVAVSDDGERSYIFENKGDHHYTANIGENGDYTLTVAAANGSKASYEFKVENIDKYGPGIKSYELKDGQLTVLYELDEAGMDGKSAYATDDKGVKYTPLTVDEKTGVVTYEWNDKNLQLFLKDTLGNESVHQVTKK